MEGQVLLDDEDVRTLDVTNLRRRVGMVFQRPNRSPSRSSTMSLMDYESTHGVQGPDARPVEHSLKRAALWGK